MESKKKRRIIWLVLNSALVLSVLLIGSIAAMTAAVIRAGINIQDIPDFTYTDANGNEFKCYNPDPGSGQVEIGWGLEPDRTPANLTVPQTVTHGANTYTVTGIVQGGFRYCDFEKITLPSTITLIEEEAFGYCTNMTEFVLPYGVTEIKDSTFIDCRSMIEFFYRDSSYNVVVTNDRVETIGDHAFASCVSLVEFTCSTVLETIEVSAFQNCKGLTRFYFPSKTGTGDSINNISVKKYAFADCSNLVWVYFEANLNEVEEYAFVDCNTDMVFHYGVEGVYPGDPVFTSHWRDKTLESRNSDYYPIETSHIVILQSNNYPGLKYTLQTDDIYLDCSLPNTNNRICLYNGGQKYAVIYQWNAPTVTVANYYNVATKALEIPGVLTFDGVDYPLKVINKETFANKSSDIKSVKFNTGLIQICEKAFFKCDQIESLDFSQCDSLLEISNAIFNDRTSGTTNEHVTTLTLPNSLEYIGKYAFYCFRKVEYLSFKTHSNQSNNLKVLGGYSFGRIGEYYDRGVIDVTLPCTLNDAIAKRANINKADSDYNEHNWAAIGPYCFGAGVDKQFSCVKRITMEECHHAHASDMNYTCSISPNAFNRAKYLTKFVANANLCMVGNESFKNTNSIREIFLTTTKAIASGKPIPWGTKSEAGTSYEMSIISGGNDKTPKTDLLIYLDGPAPGNINSLTGIDKPAWNAESNTAFNSDFGYKTDDADHGFPRSSLPTFYNTDFDFSSGSILYWKPSDGTFLDEVPSEISDYDEGFIVFAKEKNSSNYTVAHYYSNSANLTKEIDLTGITTTINGNTVNVSNNITTIGPEAFATNSANPKGFYFVLPNTVTKIDERAFFRKANNSQKVSVAKTGVRIITYKDSNGVIQPSTAEYNAARDACVANDKNDTLRANMVGYCTLPTTLTHIGRNAFYNNIFGEVNIGSNLAFLGKSAFFTMADTTNNNVRSKLTTINIGSNSVFDYINGGLYYVGNNAKKTLLYQTQANTGTLTLASGTMAVNMSACANTSYTKIKLNASLTHIYGSAFQHNRLLTEVENDTTMALKYIGAIAPNDEIFDDSLPFDNLDYRIKYDSDKRAKIESRNNAFSDCPELTTVNFKEMTNLVKIGHAAFKNCGKLEQCAGGDSYSYYTYDGSNTSLLETKTTGVLDLSPCTALRVIGREAFYGDSKIKYVHLPATNGLLSVARDKADAPWTSGDDSGKIFDNSTVKFLIGDNADKTYTGASGTHASSDRWSNVWHNSAPVYYHASSSSDLLTGSTVASLRYWTENPSGGYILFENYANASAYFS